MTGQGPSAIQIIARGSRRAAEAAAAAMDADPALESAAYSIIEEDEDKGLWRIDAYPVSNGEAVALRTRLASYPDLRVSVQELADADWLAMALSGLPPVRAGRFFVFGAHDMGRAPAGAIKLRIEAGAAFGTGHHGTTVGCLLAYDSLRKRRRFARVLDVGSGTGILAIAAALTGASLVVGTDIDPVSVRIARENARINRARCRFALAGDLGQRQVRSGAPYDLIFANILARPLVGLARSIADASGPGGRVVLSGLLHAQARRVLAAYLAQGFRLERRLRRDAWSTLVLRRP